MFDEIKKSVREIQQPRSNFQIEKFVLGQHPTPEMRYYQLLLELGDMIHKYELAEIHVKMQELKIKKLEAKADEMSQLKIQKIEAELKVVKNTMLGASREIEFLKQLYDMFEHKYTREEIEAAQPQYWEARLENDVTNMLMGGNPVNYAHIDSMKQAGVLENFVEKVAESKRELGL